MRWSYTYHLNHYLVKTFFDEACNFNLTLMVEDLINYWDFAEMTSLFLNMYNQSIIIKVLILFIISFSQTLVLDCVILSSYFVLTRADCRCSYLSFLLPPRLEAKSNQTNQQNFVIIMGSIGKFVTMPMWLDIYHNLD